MCRENGLAINATAIFVAERYFAKVVAKNK